MQSRSNSPLNYAMLKNPADLAEQIHEVIKT